MQLNFLYILVGNSHVDDLADFEHYTIESGHRDRIYLADSIELVLRRAQKLYSVAWLQSSFIYA